MSLGQNGGSGHDPKRRFSCCTAGVFCHPSHAIHGQILSSPLSDALRPGDKRCRDRNLAVSSYSLYHSLIPARLVRPVSNTAAMKYAYVCPLILAYSPLVYFASAHVTLRQASSPPGFHRPQGTRNPLLTGDCALAQYTLIDDGPTWYYVPFVGCISGRPGCCPFTPAPQGQIAATAGSSRAVYPQPRDAKDATLRTCPADYYFISGSCCPRYVQIFLSQLAGRRLSRGLTVHSPPGRPFWEGRHRASARSRRARHRRPLRTAWKPRLARNRP